MTDSATETHTGPYTGQEYLESLRDGREIWIYGERVKDVTAHPAFRNTVRMIARLYDALHSPEHQQTLTTATDTGNGSFTQETRALGLELAERLVSHVQKEEMSLLPALEDILDEGTDHELACSYAAL